MTSRLVDCLMLVFENVGKPNMLLPLLLLSKPDENTILTNGKKLPKMEWKADIELFDKLFYAENEWKTLLSSSLFEAVLDKRFSFGNSSYPTDQVIKKLGRARHYVVSDSSVKFYIKCDYTTGYAINNQADLRNAFEKHQLPEEIGKMSFFFRVGGVPDHVLELATKPFYIMQELEEMWYITYHPKYSKPLGITQLRSLAYQMAYEDQALDFALNCELLKEKGYRIIREEGMSRMDAMNEIERAFKGPYIV